MCIQPIHISHEVRLGFWSFFRPTETSTNLGVPQRDTFGPDWHNTGIEKVGRTQLPKNLPEFLSSLIFHWEYFSLMINPRKKISDGFWKFLKLWRCPGAAFIYQPKLHSSHKYLLEQSKNTSLTWINEGKNGSGGGTSGRAMAFCLNPGSDFGFFSVQNCCQSILTGCGAFCNNV